MSGLGYLVPIEGRYPVPNYEAATRDDPLVVVLDGGDREQSSDR
jgi:hypothetical protein